MTRNSKVLEDFTRYCIEHPEERFWQALRNWSGAAGIFLQMENIVNFFQIGLVMVWTIHFIGKIKNN